MKILLASGSPRRIELLRGSGFEVRVHPSGVDESFDGLKTPAEIAEFLAKIKAEAVLGEEAQDEFIVAADTSVVIGDKILGKPKDREDAINMLESLSGKYHEVYTGIAVIYRKKLVTSHCVTRVLFDSLSKELIENYVDTGEPMDKAGAYGIQHYGPALVKGIDGDYFNVMGLPLNTLYGIFDKEFGIKPLSWIKK